MADEASEQRPSSVAVVTDEELQLAFEGPAVFSNKFYVTTSGANARLSFTELAPKATKPVFRTAVVLSVADLLKLAEVIKHVTRNVQQVRIEASPKKQDG